MLSPGCLLIGGFGAPALILRRERTAIRRVILASASILQGNWQEPLS